MGVLEGEVISRSKCCEKEWVEACSIPICDPASKWGIVVAWEEVGDKEKKIESGRCKR